MVAFMAGARAAGILPPLDPIMGIIFLPLPVIPSLRIRPEGMFDVTTFSYAEVMVPPSCGHVAGGEAVLSLTGSCHRGRTLAVRILKQEVCDT